MMKNATIPKTAKKIALRPLALGEKTGHHHSLMADPGVELAEAVEMFEGKDGEIYVRIHEEGVRLVHQEHKAHHIAPGDYQVTIQQENSDWGSRAVLD
jgi:hypothetical protein